MPPCAQARGGAREAGGGVMNFSTVAHDPSGPPGHLPSFAGEEGVSASHMARSQRLFQAGAAEAFQIVVAVGVMLERHLLDDPDERDIGLCPTQLPECGS